MAKNLQQTEQCFISLSLQVFRCIRKNEYLLPNPSKKVCYPTKVSLWEKIYLHMANKYEIKM